MFLRHPIVRLTLFSLFAFPVVAHANFDGSFSKWVFDCEEAAARLEECCVTPPAVSCEWYETNYTGCDGRPETDRKTPSLSEADANDLSKMSCEAILSGNRCQTPGRAQ